MKDQDQPSGNQSANADNFDSTHRSLDSTVGTVQVSVADLVTASVGIAEGCEFITPEMLALVELDQQQIDVVVRTVPGGARNLQDIYPLSPLQEGMLFHRLLNEKSDVYVLSTLFELESRDHVAMLTDALQKLIARHDILRTAVLWQQLPRPVQVVYRQASLPVEEVTFDSHRDLAVQITEWTSPVRQSLDLRSAPLVRLQVAADPHGSRWYAVLRVHHLLCDHQSLKALVAEVMTVLRGREQDLPPPIQFRIHVADALADDEMPADEAFFRSKLGDVVEPTVPFGVAEDHGQERRIEEACASLDPVLSEKIRAQSRRWAVGTARLFHAAWAMVVARTSGMDDVIFGTVVLASRQRVRRVQRMLGMSVNTLPLRLHLRGVTAEELVLQTQRELAELLMHERASLALAQSCSGVAAAAPLFTALFNFRRNAPNGDNPADSYAGIRVLSRREAWTNYPIALTVDDLGEGFELTAQTDQRIDPRRIMDYLRTSLLSLVDALDKTPQRPALSLTVLPTDERREVLELFNATHTAYPENKLIHELFEEQAQRAPRAVAVAYAEQSLTYAELNGKANQLARYLRGRGVGPDRLVGLCIERGLEMVIALLGILKAGAAYLPLDPNYPPARLKYMLEDAAPCVVLTQEVLQPLLPAELPGVIELNSVSHEIAEYSTEDIWRGESDLNAQHLLYVIYTSGSTGRPKGTAMPHVAMVNLIEWHREKLSAQGRRVLQFAALSFDVAFQETFSTLCTGGTLVLIDEWARKDAYMLLDLLSSQRIDCLFLPPLMLQSLAESSIAGAAVPRHLLDVVTAGEQLRISPEIIGFFKHLTGCRLHNHYGPTETHVVTAVTLAGNPDEWASLPTIGRPIANTQIYVLDGQRQPLPIGVAGEIHIGGASVARGYLRRPELTACRFFPDPFTSAPHGRSYATGDLGRWRTDGTLEYLGRNDEQVKIRGFRVELGEIEAQLALHASVKQVAVVAQEIAPGEKRLVAYVTKRGLVASDAEELRAHVKGALPEHMVPSAFVSLDTMPLTPSGKLNRRALPAPEVHTGHQYEPPRGRLEQSIAHIWKEVLRVERVGRQDDFFELGGNSLLAMRVLARIRSAFFVEMQIKALFEHRTLSEVSMHVDGLSRTDLFDVIAKSDADVEKLLERVASLSERGVQDLIRNLRMEERQ